MNEPEFNPQLTGVTVRLYPDGRMDAESAATYVGLRAKTLANLRCRGLGPRFVKRGRIFYFKRDLDEWLEAGRAQSTAQARLRKQSEDTEHESAKSPRLVADCSRN